MTKRPRGTATLVLALALLASVRPASAQQVLEVEAERTVTVDVPADGLTLFRTEGAKLLKVRHLQRELAAEADPDKSEVTIQPLKASGVTALFLVTETLTIPVNVRIEKGRGARTIVLRTPAPPPAPAPKRKVQDPHGPAQEQVRSIKDIVIAAMGQTVDESVYEVSHAGKTLPPVDSLQVFYQFTVTSARGLSGRRYVITNPTDRTIVLDERKLRAADALAVAVEEVELEPGSATVAVVVHSSGD